MRYHGSRLFILLISISDDEKFRMKNCELNEREEEKKLPRKKVSVQVNWYMN